MMGPAFSSRQAGGCQELGEVTAAVVLADSLEASEAAASRVSTCVLVKAACEPLCKWCLACSFRYLLRVPGRDHSQELGVHGSEPLSLCGCKGHFMKTPKASRSVPLQLLSVSHHHFVLLAPSVVGQPGLVASLLQ